MNGNAFNPNYAFSISFHRLLHPECCVAATHGVVFMGQGCTEKRHDAITHDLIDCSLIPVHGLHHVFEDRVEQFPRILRITVRKQLHGAFHVGKQHCYLLAFAFKCALGGEDSLRKMLRGITLRGLEFGRRRRRVEQHRSTLTTKFISWRVRSSACRARRVKPCPTLTAELHSEGILMPAVRAPHSKGPMGWTIFWLIEDKPEIRDLLYSVRNSDCAGQDDSFQDNA